MAINNVNAANFAVLRSGTSGTSGTMDFSGSVVKGAGLDLVTPTSIANSGGSASLSGGAVTFTAVNSISLNGCFTSTYQNYQIVYTQVQSAQIAAYIRLRASGTDVSGSVYWYGANVAPASGGTPTNNNASGVNAWDPYGGGTIADFHIINMSNPFQSVVKMITFNGSVTNGTSTYGIAGSGHLSSTSSCDGLTLYTGSGTTTGTIRVYGYRNS